MRKILTIFSVLLGLFSITRCTDDHDLEREGYFIEFKIKGKDGADHMVRVTQTDPTHVDRHDIFNSESVAVSFSLVFTFESPEQADIFQALYFVIAMEIPKREFELVSGKYVFKQPANLVKYIPSGNLFEADSYVLSAYYHEDMMTYCTASTDSAFQNSFIIKEKKFVFDEHGNRLMELKGRLDIRYESFCNEEDIELSDGNFVVRLLVEPV